MGNEEMYQEYDNDPVVSRTYRNGGVSKNSDFNRMNEKLAKEYKDSMARAEAERIAELSKRAGADDAYLDIARRLQEANNQYTPVQEGSPMDIQMQKGVDEGLKYKEEYRPSLLDAIGSKIGRAATNVSDSLGSWLNSNDQPEMTEYQRGLQNRLRKEQESFDSEQAGLAELKQQLNNRQQR